MSAQEPTVPEPAPVSWSPVAPPVAPPVDPGAPP
ncbi:DUF4190 domain-containing protein, partial [Clavibacter nebraskensis]